MANAPKKVNRPWVPERKPFARTRTATDFDYNSRTWRKFSTAYKERHPLCVLCEAAGIVAASKFTDHIVQIKAGGAHYDEANLQALCEKCHNSKSGRERHY